MRNYYVDTDAADDTGDGSVGDPWQLLTTALGQDEDLDVVGGGDSLTINVYGSVDQDLTLVILSGWGTSTTNRLYIQSTEAGWDGKWDDAVWHATNANNNGLEIRDEYVILNKIMFEKLAQSGSYQPQVQMNALLAANEIIVANCLFKGAAAAQRMRALYAIDADTVLRVYTCAFYNGATTAHGAASYIRFEGTTLTVDNCVFDGGASQGILQVAGTVTVYNSLFTLATNPTGGTFGAASDYNSTDGATAVANDNTNDLESQTITYTSAANGDFTLTGHGVDSGGALPIYDFGSVDIIGTAKPQNSVWDRGVFEVISAPGGVNVVPLLRHRRQMAMR